MCRLGGIAYRKQLSLERLQQVLCQEALTYTDLERAKRHIWGRGQILQPAAGPKREQMSEEVASLLQTPRGQQLAREVVARRLQDLTAKDKLSGFGALGTLLCCCIPQCIYRRVVRA